MPGIHVPHPLEQLPHVHAPELVTEHVHGSTGGVLPCPGQAQQRRLPALLHAAVVAAAHNPVLTGL